MRPKLWIIFLLLTMSWTSNIAAETLSHMKINDEKEQILLDILKLAISKVDPSITFEPHPEDMTSTRLIAELQAGDLDIFWAGVIPEYEETLLPIHIPVLRGMLGHRIFIIEQGKQHMFDGINSLEDLKTLKAGQGRTWGDTKVLVGAGLPTITTLHYHNLFRMLEGDRFDYFPRAIHEPWSEIKAHPEFDFTIEKRILLVYPFAMYFFVAQNNEVLHDIIYKGMEMAIADGSYDKLFFSSPLVKDALGKSNLGDRIVIKIPNPAMSTNTPYNRKEFWLDIENL